MRKNNKKASPRKVPAAAAAKGKQNGSSSGRARSLHNNPDAPAASTEVKILQAKGRPMLTWVGKRPLRLVRAFPAQEVERYGIIESSASELGPDAGHLLHGDNKEVLAALLANGYRGKIQLIYIDPPFDSGADYVRTVSLRGSHGTAKIGGESYTLGEQIQYTDIWANDNYLQFLFERLILLRELLADGGSIWVHCDWHKSHHIRCLLDEVFGADNLLNEVIWQRTDPHNDAKSRLGWVHDTLYWYRKGEKAVYNWKEVVDELSDAALREYSLILKPNGQIEAWSPGKEGRRFKLDDCTYKGTDPTRRFVWRGAQPSPKRVWPYATAQEMDAAVKSGEFYLRDAKVGAARCRVSFLDEREGQLLQTIWTECGRMKGGVDYPTQKPEALLERIITATSNPGDIVLDCFVGSGTSVVVAQALGRRWIGCDINKGAIQTTTRRLQSVISAQTAAQDNLALEDSEVRPSQLGFVTWRVNDYDLQLQHNEATKLAAEAIGIQQNRADGFFDGTLGASLVKIIPFSRPLTVVDLEGLRKELDARPDEDRSIVLVCLGIELSARAWIDEWNSRRRAGALNKIQVIELRTDAKFGGLMQHTPPKARLSVRRNGGKIEIKVLDFVSPSVVQRLQQQAGVLSPRITDWRTMIDSIMIDPTYDGKTFRIHIADIPERKADLVQAEYEISVPKGKTTVAVKITDMLGEEIIESVTL